MLETEIGNLLLTPVYIEEQTSFDFNWFAVYEDENFRYDTFEDADILELEMFDEDNTDYEFISELDPYRTPYHVKSWMVVDWDFTGDDESYNSDGWHTGFGNHEFECYVDVSDTPRTLIYYEHYDSRRRL